MWASPRAQLRTELLSSTWVNDDDDGQHDQTSSSRCGFCELSWTLLNFSMFSPDSQWRLLPWGRAPCWSLWPAETWGESRWISSRQRTARRPAALPASGGWRTAWAAPSRPAVRWAEVRSCCPQVRLHFTAGGSLQPKTGGGDSCDEQLDFECLLIAILLMLVSIPTQDLQEQWHRYRHRHFDLSQRMQRREVGMNLQTKPGIGTAIRKHTFHVF